MIFVLNIFILQSTSITNEEPKTVQPAPNLNSILEAGTEGLETLALSGLGLGFRAAIPKMPSFRVSYSYL